MKKKVDITDIDPLAFVGLRDENIKVIESKFNSKIVFRGNTINLDGEKAELDLIESIINDMISTINQKGSIDKNDVQALIALAETSNGELIHSSDEGIPIVLHTYQGAVCARTDGQKKYFSSVRKNDIVFAIGPAGTGKTYQAVASAVASLKRKEVDRIVITRPAVEAGERLGFLPGDLKEKVDPYLTPLYDALNDMIPRDKLKIYLESRVIEVAPLAYIAWKNIA